MTKRNLKYLKSISLYNVDLQSRDILHTMTCMWLTDFERDQLFAFLNLINKGGL